MNLGNNTDYWDKRVEERFISLITIENGEIKKIEEKTLRGTGVRFLNKNVWSLSFTNKQKIIRKLKKNKKNSSISKKPIKGKFKLKPKTDIRDFDVERKIKLLKDVEKYFHGERIKSVSVTLYAFHRRMEFEDSIGSNASQEYPITSIFVSLTGKDNARLERYSISFGDSKGLELITEKSWEKIGNETKEKIYDLLKANKIKGGKYNAILDNELAGVFIHEALGHAAELDHAIESHTILKDKENERIAPDFFNLISTHTKESFGFYFFDDEGIRKKDTYIIKDGVFVNYMSDLKSSLETGKKLTANGRAQDYSHFPIVRMNTLYIKPMKATLDELLEEMKNGLYLIGFTGGETSPSDGNFLFKTQIGYLVENGEIKKPLKDVSLGGHTLETLKKIKLLSRDLKKDKGFCGKDGQSVPVAEIVPKMLIENITVGGE